MISLRISPKQKLSILTLKELLALLVEHDQLACKFQAALGREPDLAGVRNQVDSEIPNRPIELEDCEDFWCVDAVVNGATGITTMGWLESWIPDPNVPGEFIFEVSITLWVKDLAACGIEPTDISEAQLAAEEIELWFETNTAAIEPDGSFTVELLKLVVL